MIYFDKKLKVFQFFYKTQKVFHFFDKMPKVFHFLTRFRKSSKDLRSLHPPADPPALPNQDESPLAYQFESVLVWKSLKCSAKWTVAGPRRHC